MDSGSIKVRRSLSTGIFIICCALAMFISGCNRSSQTPKALEPKKAPVAPLVPNAKLAQKYVGKYLNKKYPNDFTELKSDGTFLYQEGKNRLTGKYAVQDDRLLLALPDGSGSLNKINDQGITDVRGDLWKRK